MEQKVNAITPVKIIVIVLILIIIVGMCYIFIPKKDETKIVKETELIKEVSAKEPCVIVGRCADQILKDNKNVLKVFIYSNMEDKINRAVKYYGMDKKKAEKEISRIDKLRGNHYKYYTGKEWKDFSNYDICINSDKLGVEKAADLIIDMAKQLEKKKKKVAENITQ